MLLEPCCSTAIEELLTLQGKSQPLGAKRPQPSPKLPPGSLHPPGQPDMSINPLLFEGDCRETHAHLESDARFFRIDEDRPEALDHHFQPIVERYYLGRF